ncbi:MAG TPA: DUF2213 domain-containing protein [Leptospiraceae bacterium]|nr:DUF2213 domain-containing protein [Leptospiraceae bacterium]
MENRFEYRFDRADVISFTEENGFFKAKVRLTKPGVYPYLLGDGTIRKEAKLPDEIFNPAFLKSLDGIPITDGHPYEHGGLVNSDNYNQLMKGIITNPRIEDGFVVADETLFDPALIASVKAGEKREVSLGLKAKQYAKTGSYSGAVYDSIQTEMRANHVAHVVKGRVDNARIVLDGIEYGIQQGENSMADIATQEAEPIWLNGFLDKIVSKILSVFEAKKAEPAVVADSSATLTNRIVTDEKARSLSGLEVTTTSKKETILDAAHYEKRIADLEKTISDITKGISVKLDEAVARDGIVDAVKAVLPEADLKGKSNSEIKTVLIQSILPDVKLDSAELIDVYYNASLELAKAKAKLSPGKVEIKQDEADLTALKTKRLNLYQGAK